MRQFGWVIVSSAVFFIPGCGNDPASNKATSNSTKPSPTPTVDPKNPVEMRSDKGRTAVVNKNVRVVPDGTKLKLAFICNNASNFWLIAQKGIQKAEKEFGISVDFRQPPTGKISEQNQYLEDLVAQGFHGIAISPIAPDGQTPELNKAAAKTNLITQDSDAAESNRLAYIGTNNFEAGKALGKEIVRLLPKGGKVAVFVGTFSADNARQRLAGIESAIDGKNIKIVARKEDNKDANKAMTNVEDVLNSMPDVDLLAGLWSYNAPRIAAALKAKKGTKVIGVGFDEDDETLQAIEDGTLDCTVVQKPFEFGYQSVKLLRNLAIKGVEALPPNNVIDTGIEVITKTNVKEFKARLADMKK